MNKGILQTKLQFIVEKNVGLELYFLYQKATNDPFTLLRAHLDGTTAQLKLETLFTTKIKQQFLVSNYIKQFIDRTPAILSAAANSTTSPYYVDYCKAVNSRIVLTSASVPGTYALQGSDDNLNWFNMTTPVLAVTSAVNVLTAANYISKYARVACTTSGSGQLGSYVSIVAVQ